MYGPELWWKGEKENVAIGKVNDLQIVSASKHEIPQEL